MASMALDAFLPALDEIKELGMAAQLKIPTTSRSTLKVARAIGRGQVVLLSSHFERYFYAINEEAVQALNSSSTASAIIPASIKLLHSSEPLDALSRTGWDRRGDGLARFVASDGWLWVNSTQGALLHDRLLAWMKSPKPKELVRYYKYWGINDIFSEITRSAGSRNRLWLGVQELVDMRNNIAHGDYTSQATQNDVRRYMESAQVFCTRADRALLKAMKKLQPAFRAWQ